MLKYSYSVKAWVGVGGASFLPETEALVQGGWKPGQGDRGPQPRGVTASPSGAGLLPTQIKANVQKREEAGRRERGKKQRKKKERKLSNDLIQLFVSQMKKLLSERE